jgi:hypothetical protein
MMGDFDWLLLACKIRVYRDNGWTSMSQTQLQYLRQHNRKAACQLSRGEHYSYTSRQAASCIV